MHISKGIMPKWLLALLAIVSLVFFFACGSGEDGKEGGDEGGDDVNVREAVSYTGTVGLVVYELEIKDRNYVAPSRDARAALTPMQGDIYTLTAGDKTSNGTVNSFESGVLTLMPQAEGSIEISVAVGSGKITAMTGIIIWDGGETQTLDGLEFPDTPNQGGDDEDEDDGEEPGTSNIFTLNNAPMNDESHTINIFVQARTFDKTSDYSAVSTATGYIFDGSNSDVLTWGLGGDRNGTYGVYIVYDEEAESRYLNDVKFTDGSATLDWNTMLLIEKEVEEEGVCPEEFAEADFPDFVGGEAFVGTWETDYFGVSTQEIVINSDGTYTYGMQGAIMMMGSCIVSEGSICFYDNALTPGVYTLHSNGTMGADGLELQEGALGLYADGQTWTKK